MPSVASTPTLVSISANQFAYSLGFCTTASFSCGCYFDSWSNDKNVDAYLCMDCEFPAPAPVTPAKVCLVKNSRFVVVNFWIDGDPSTYEFQCLVPSNVSEFAQCDIGIEAAFFYAEIMGNHSSDVFEIKVNV